MRKLWRVAAYEYRRNVFKRGFLLTLASVPLMLVLNISLGVLLALAAYDDRPVGYVDAAGVLAQATPAPQAAGRLPVVFRAFASQAEARAALQAQAIQAYFHLPADYLETRRAELFYLRPPADYVTPRFTDFLKANLLRAQPGEIAARAALGTEVKVRSADGRRTALGGDSSLGMLLALLFMLAMLALLLVSSGYLLAAVADEKENRTIEILMTSASPMQLIGGKVAGIVAISLTLLATWMGVLGLVVALVGRVEVEGMQFPALDLGPFLTIAAIAVPAYVLAAAVMTAIGATAPSTQDGQSLGTLVVLLHLVPIYLGPMLLNEPHSPLAVGLSLLPGTALMAVGLRSLVTAVPAWQLAVSIGLQLLCAVGGVWLASRAFRVGMLHYGQRPIWRRLLPRWPGRA